MKCNENYLLNNGVRIPVIGFGTFPIPNGEDAYNAVSLALKAGYRLIDTAFIYGNEESVGKAVRDSGIDRKEVFIISKSNPEVNTFEETLESFEKTNKNIGLGYIDLYLIHSPRSTIKTGNDLLKENLDIWRGMEEIYTSGRCHAIGVSNFKIPDLIAIRENCKIPPMANEIKFFIGNTQDELLKFCQNNEIIVIGYTPLARGHLLKNEKIGTIAQKYNKTNSQICIRYVVQKGVIPVPKSSHSKYIMQNAEIDFEIDKEDMGFLDSLKITVDFKQNSSGTKKAINNLKRLIRSIIGSRIYYRLKYRN